MRSSRTFLLASLLVAGVVHAATIVTPPVIPDADGGFFCLVTNASVRPLVVGIDVVDVNGGTSRHFGFTVPPLATRAAPGHADDRLCRITADGGRSAIRASVQVLSATDEIEAVYPVP